MFTSSDSDKHWEQFGRLDPYFGVVTHAEYHGHNLTEQTIEKFFKSGEDYVDFVFQVIREHLVPGFQPNRALDFGCGVARLTIPIARESKAMVGVDVSESMLLEATRNCAKRAVHNVEFKRSDDGLTQVSGEFDFINSYLVFQHIPCERGETILRSLLARLSENGCGALHFTFSASRGASIAHWVFRHIPFAPNLYNVFIGRGFAYPKLQMNLYNLNRLFVILSNAGCAQVLVYFTAHGRTLGATLFFRKGSASAREGQIE